MFTAPEVQPEVFWTFVSIIALGMQAIFRWALKLQRADRFAIQLSWGGMLASGIATGIAFHGTVWFLPLNFKNVADAGALCWIVVFWTGCWAPAGFVAMTRTLRMRIPEALSCESLGKLEQES